MKKFLLLIILMIFISASALSETIVTSIKPLALVLESICGSQFEIRVLMENTNPHLYQLKVSDVKSLYDADLIVLSGIEEWIDKAKELFPEKVMVFSDGIFEQASKQDQHLWLDPVYTVLFAHQLYKEISSTYPEFSQILRENWKNFADEVFANLSLWYEKLSPLRKKTLLELHPALIHFAKRFDLGDIVFLESGHEEGLTTKKINEVSKLIKEKQIRYIITESSIESSTVINLAQQLKLPVVEIDVLASNSRTYVEFINSLVSALIVAENTHR